MRRLVKGVPPGLMVVGLLLTLGISACSPAAAPNAAAISGASPSAAMGSEMTPAQETVKSTRITSSVVVFHGNREAPQVALTFDACQDRGPVTGFDRPIVEMLNDTQTPATLFLSGLWIKHHPRETAELAANPLFELGNHSWSHPDFERLDSETMVREIVDTQALIAGYTGREPALFRFPYGRYNEAAVKIVTDQGLAPVQWDVEPGDPGLSVSAADILATVEEQTQNGSIIILHMNGNGRQTAEALAYIIRYLRQRGFELVTVSQMLEERSAKHEGASVHTGQTTL